MNIDERYIKALGKLGITNPTAIQKETLPPIIDNKNVIACSPTGTGKTIAYLLPVMSANIDNASLYAIVLVPSKELAIQICSQINQLSNNAGIPVTAAAIFGGVNRTRQLETLKSRPNIVVGTCQGIMPLIRDRKIRPHTVRTLIIDEADKLLDKDNIDNVIELRKTMMRDIQILIFSASISMKTTKTASLLTKEKFVNIFTNEKASIPKNIEHIYFTVEKRERINMTRKVIKALDAGHCLIFANSKYDSEEIAQKLAFHNYNAKCLNSNLDKNARRQIIDGFNSGKINFLVCSDILARGLDFKHVNTIINIGLPEKSVDYQHRAGRCGRDGQKAVCASIITDNELPIIKNLQKNFGINILRKNLYQGKIVRK